jgi:hypothetical protein
MLSKEPPRARDEFERYPALASWIERLGNTDMNLPLGEWCVFVGALNHALQAARSEAERDDPTEGLSGKVTAIARKAGSGALLDGGEIELIEEAARRLADDDARMQRAAEALRPFAEACAHLHPSQPDNGVTLDGFKVADFRRAAEVYAAISQAPSDE